MSMQFAKLSEVSTMKTGKLNSNAAVQNGAYPFFTCARETYKIDTVAFDTEAVLLGGNNANGIFPLKYYKGPFNAYQRTYIIETRDQKILLTRYLYYALRPALKNFESASIGATTQYLTKGILDNFELLIPPIKAQTRIAAILSAYDDLIENNRRRIVLLEEAARLLYREWFVHLRFPSFESTKITNGVPEGWESLLLRDVILTNPENYKKGKLPETINYVDISSVSTGCINYKTKMLSVNAPGRARRIAKHGDVIWSNVRPNLKAYNLVLNPNENDVFSTGFTILKPVGISSYFLYFHSTSDQFVEYLMNHATGTSYPAVRPEDFEKADVLVPSKHLSQVFDEFCEPIFQQIGLLHDECEFLTKARDLLLPRLMDGRIAV